MISPDRGRHYVMLATLANNRRSGAAFLRVEFELRVTQEENSIDFSKARFREAVSGIDCAGRHVETGYDH